MAFPPSIFVFSWENAAHMDFPKTAGSEVMDQKRSERRGQLLTCSVAAVSSKRRPSWDIEMKTCSFQLYFYGLASDKSIQKMSDLLWFAGQSRLYLILNKNWCMHSLIKLIIFEVC
jgi:hypothetical protein